MAIAVVFDGSGVPREKYDEVLALGGAAVVEQPARTEHISYESGDGFCVVDVWEDEEAFARFGETVLGPAFAKIGLELPPPAVYPVHNLMGRHPESRNVATVGAMYAAFGRGDIPAILDALSEDVEWERDRPDHGVPWLKPGRGKAFVAEFFASLSALEIKRFQPRSVIGDGGTVVALIDVEAVVVDTGRSIVDLEVHVWTFDEAGNVTSLRHVVDTASHLAALNG